MNQDKNKDQRNISKIYKLLQKFNTEDNKVKEEWEKELGINRRLEGLLKDKL